MLSKNLFCSPQINVFYSTKPVELFISLTAVVAVDSLSININFVYHG